MDLSLLKFLKNSNLDRRSELWLAVPFLALLLALKALLLYLTWRGGFLEYDTDGFTRSLHAWEWGQRPHLEVDAWLPLQFGLNGFLMTFWNDLFREPRAVNILASFLTTVNFFFIGRYLLGRGGGYYTALLAAFFPWEIWFALSGMSESLTQVLLSLGLAFFCRWLYDRRIGNLWGAGLSLAGATMLRYEAWFYSLVLAGLVLLFTFWENRSQPRIAFIKLLRISLPLALAFGFAFIWLLASWVQLGSPLGFVSLTSKINASLEEQNASISLLGRLLFYPRIFFKLLPPLTLLVIGGSLLAFWQSPAKIRLYLALIWGEFLLFIISTLPTNNIAPGSARYPVSNLMFMLPLVVYPGLWLAKAFPFPAVRYSLLLGLLALPLFFAGVTLKRSNDFPDANMRQVALWFKDQTARGKLPPNTVIPAHFPNPASPAGEDYTLVYGLSVLTNRPDGWRIEGSNARGIRVISEIEGFEKTIHDDKPLAWIHYSSAGDEQRISQLGERYREKLIFGPYKVFAGPLDRPLEVSPAEGSLQQHFLFKGEDFDPGERVYLWISYDTSGAKSLESVNAGPDGRFTLNYLPGPEVPGTFSITARGENSQRRAIGEVTIKPRVS